MSPDIPALTCPGNINEEMWQGRSFLLFLGSCCSIDMISLILGVGLVVEMGVGRGVLGFTLQMATRGGASG